MWLHRMNCLALGNVLTQPLQCQWLLEFCLKGGFTLIEKFIISAGNVKEEHVCNTPSAWCHFVTNPLVCWCTVPRALNGITIAPGMP